MTLDLEAIKARAEAATPGPWERRITTFTSCGVQGPEMAIYDEGGHGEEDAEFIAHARTDIPALVAEVERLRQLKSDADAVISACVSKLRDGDEG